MEQEKIIVGLDIGTTKICAIVGRKNEFGKLEVLGMGKAESEGVVKGIVFNIDKTVYAIEKAIKEASDQSGIDIGVVNVGIAGQHIRSFIQHGGITRSSKEDEITVDDVERLTQDMYRMVVPPGSQIIHVMPQDYMVDYEDGIKEPVECPVFVWKRIFISLPHKPMPSIISINVSAEVGLKFRI